MGTAMERLHLPGFEDLDRMVERLFDGVEPILPGVYHLASVEMEEKDGVRTYRMRLPKDMTPKIEYAGGVLRVTGNYAREVRGWRKEFAYDEEFHIGALPPDEKLERVVEDGILTLKYNVADLPAAREITMPKA